MVGQLDGKMPQVYLEDYLRGRLAQGCANGKVLLREIQEQGYRGSYTILKDFLRPLRQDERWRLR